MAISLPIKKLPIKTILIFFIPKFIITFAVTKEH